MLGNQPGMQWGQGRLGCCINRSQLSYGLTGLALIRADGAQPSLHLDEYVRVRTVYIRPCGPLRKYN